MVEQSRFAQKMVRMREYLEGRIRDGRVDSSRSTCGERARGEFHAINAEIDRPKPLLGRAERTIPFSA